MEHMGTVHGRLPDSEAPAVPSPAAVPSATTAVALRKKRKGRGQMAAFFQGLPRFPQTVYGGNLGNIGEFNGIHDSNSHKIGMFSKEWDLTVGNGYYSIRKPSLFWGIRR